MQLKAILIKLYSVNKLYKSARYTSKLCFSTPLINSALAGNYFYIIFIKWNFHNIIDIESKQHLQNDVTHLQYQGQLNSFN